MLLDDIIDILSDDDGSLTSALLKTKVLLHTIGRKELVTWVDHEIKGYPRDSEVPDYRNVTAYVFGQVTSVRAIHHHYLLPLSHLSKELQESLTKFKMYEPIDALQQAVAEQRSGGSKTLGQPIPPEILGAIGEALGPYTNVITARCELNMMNVEKILQEVRSRLLEFMLELRDVVGVDVSDKLLREKSATFNTKHAFEKTILGSATISNATIIIGDHNTQINISNTKGDMSGLLSELEEKAGISKSDLARLQTAIEQDAKDGKAPDVTEGKTSRWYLETLKKAGKGVYKTGVDVVSQVTIRAMEHYANGG